MRQYQGPNSHGFMNIVSSLHTSSGTLLPVFLHIVFPTYLVAGSRKASTPLNYVTHPTTATCATTGRKENRGERVFELGTRRSGSLMIVCRIVFCSVHTNSKHTCRSAVRLSPHTVRHIKSFTLTVTALRTLGPTTTPPVH